MAAISIDGTPMTALPADASQINYDNTRSGMAATQVQAAIDELRSGLTDLTKSNGGDAVDITDRVGASNGYIVPADGYVTLDTGGSSSGGIDIRIIGYNGYGLAYIILPSVTSNVVQSVYVRKGMIVFIQTNTTGSSTVKFRPFV